MGYAQINGAHCAISSLSDGMTTVSAYELWSWRGHGNGYHGHHTKVKFATLEAVSERNRNGGGRVPM